jgi:hypothetical protein
MALKWQLHKATKVPVFNWRLDLMFWWGTNPLLGPLERICLHQIITPRALQTTGTMIVTYIAYIYCCFGQNKVHSVSPQK